MKKGRGIETGQPAYLSLKKDAEQKEQKGKIIFWKKTDRLNPEDIS